MIHDVLYNPHRRHFLLTLLVGAGLAAYVSGSVATVYGFDLALLLGATHSDYLAPAGAAGTLYVFAKTNTGTCSLTPRLHWRRS